MTRQEIIDLIHSEYDPAPSYYKKGDDWDDGSGRIADAVMARIEALEAALRQIVKMATATRGPTLAREMADTAVAALAPEQGK